MTNNSQDFISPSFTDEDIMNAEKYGKLATQQEKYKLAKISNSNFFKALRIVDMGREGWIEHGVYIEKDQPVTNFLKIEFDPKDLDCESISCFPNDPFKYSSSLSDTRNEEGESVACDFWKSKETEVKSGGVTFKACQSACFDIDMEINKESGKPVPSGNLYIKNEGENFCRAINQQLLIFATIPESRFSASGKKIEGFNTRDVPPFKITDETFSRFEITYEYCNYFKQSFDSRTKDCYTSFGSQVSQLFFGRVITNFFLGSDSKALRESLPRFTTVSSGGARRRGFGGYRFGVNSDNNVVTSEKLNVPPSSVFGGEHFKNERGFVSRFPYASKFLNEGVRNSSSGGGRGGGRGGSGSGAGGREGDDDDDDLFYLEGLCGEAFSVFTNLIITAENFGYTEKDLKNFFLDELNNDGSGARGGGVGGGVGGNGYSKEKREEELKVWIDIFFRFRHFIVEYFNKEDDKRSNPKTTTTTTTTATIKTMDLKPHHRYSSSSSPSHFPTNLLMRQSADSERFNNFKSSSSSPQQAAPFPSTSSTSSFFSSSSSPIEQRATAKTTMTMTKTTTDFENFHPEYSLKLIKFPKRIDKTDLKTIAHVPTNKNPLEEFMKNPLGNIALGVWKDTVSLFTGKDFVWYNNIVVSIAADAAVDMMLLRASKVCKKMVEKLSRETIQHLSVKAGRYGSRMAGRLISKTLVSFASRKLTTIIITSAVRTSLVMLRLLASLASVAFNVAAAVLVIVSIISIILDLVFKQEWLDQKRSKDDIESSIFAYRTFFKDKMKLVDSETAPFTPKDIVDYIIDAQLRRGISNQKAYGGGGGGGGGGGSGRGSSSSKFKTSKNENGVGLDDDDDDDDDDEEDDNDDDVDDYKPMFDETEDEMYIKHYFAYLKSRTVNSLGQPIYPTETSSSLSASSDFDQEKMAKKIKSDINNIFNAGIFYCNIISYNASRIPFLTLDEYEEKYLKEKVENRNKALSKVCSNLTSALTVTGVCNVFLLATLMNNKKQYLYPILSIVFLLLSLFFILLLRLLETIYKIDDNNTAFYDKTRLFDFGIKDDYEAKGALEKIRVHQKVSRFNSEFLRPFNENLEKRYSEKKKILKGVKKVGGGSWKRGKGGDRSGVGGG
nr:MAG: wsv115-like protein [Porcellio scaber clopovirus]